MCYKKEQTSVFPNLSTYSFKGMTFHVLQISRMLDTDRTPSGRSTQMNSAQILAVQAVFLVLFLSLLFLKAAFDLAVSHSWTSESQWCAFSSSIYVLFCPNYQSAWQEKPQWPHHSLAAKVLHNTQLQTEAVAIFAMCFWCFPSLWSVEFIWFWTLFSPLIPTCFVVFPVFFSLCFIFQQNFYSVLWFKQFIHQQHDSISIPLEWPPL